MSALAGNAPIKVFQPFLRFWRNNKMTVNGIQIDRIVSTLLEILDEIQVIGNGVAEIYRCGFNPS